MSVICADIKPLWSISALKVSLTDLIITFYLFQVCNHCPFWDRPPPCLKWVSNISIQTNRKIDYMIRMDSFFSTFFYILTKQKNTQNRIQGWRQSILKWRILLWRAEQGEVVKKILLHKIFLEGDFYMLISLIMKHYIFLQSSIRINEIANFNPNIKTAIKGKMAQFEQGN